MTNAMSCCSSTVLPRHMCLISSEKKPNPSLRIITQSAVSTRATCMPRAIKKQKKKKIVKEKQGRVDRVPGLEGMSRCLATHKVDVVIIKRGAGKNGTMWVEGSAGNGGRAVVVQEARVWFERGQICSIHVECLDLMAIRAALIESVSYRTGEHPEGKENHIHHEYGSVLVNTQRPEGIFGGINC